MESDPLPRAICESLLIDSMADAVVTTNDELRITSWNPGAMTVYGWTREEALGRTVVELLGTVFTSEAHRTAASAQLWATGRWRGEVVQVHKDGHRLSVLSVVTIIRDANGASLGLVAVNRDMTPQREAERALAQAEARLTEVQRLDALGELAGSVAHDFNNLLAIIGGRAELALDLLDRQHPAWSAVDQIRASVERGATLAHQLLSFGRRDSLDIEVVDVVALIQGIDEVLRRMVGPNSRIEFVLPALPVYVRASRGELEQVLINLCGNARDAMAGGGRVLITVTAPSAECTELAVADDGAGMTPEVQARAFEAFFTTKPPGKGSGLGLAVVSRVVARSGGTVELESALGVGTRVALRFPTTAGQPRVGPSSAPAVRRSRVLLAEDQELVREVLAELIGTLGHDVVTANDGQMAIGLGEAEAFDLFITDVSMPVVSGPTAAAALRALRPSLPVIYLSGFPRDQEPIASGVWPPGVFRVKPLRREELRSAIEEAMGAAPPG